MESAEIESPLMFPVWDYILHKLSSDPIYHIFSLLNFHDLSSNACVCIEWYQNIFSNNRLWLDLCQSFWANKYVPSQYRKLIQQKEIKTTSECIARKAFRLAYLDRTRTTLTVDELVQFRWYFRFKEQAGEMWLNIDPYWNDETDDDSDNKIDWNDSHSDDIMQYKPSELIGILTDDEIEEYKLKQLKHKESLKQNKKVLSEHEKRLLRCTRVRFVRDGAMEFENTRLNDIVDTDTFMWRFGGTFCEDTLFGDMLQVNSYPKKYISRHPIHWGFIMQSCWVIYTSFPLPMIHSEDDKWITTHGFKSLRGYADMIQYNYMGGVTMDEKSDDDDDKHEKWMDAQGMFDLEYLKAMKHDMMNENDDSKDVTNTLDLQYAIALFLQRYNG